MPQRDVVRDDRGRDARPHRTLLWQGLHELEWDRLQGSKDKHGLAPADNRRARRLDRVLRLGPAAVLLGGRFRKDVRCKRPRVASYLARSDRTQQGSLLVAVQSRLSRLVRASPGVE